MAEYIYILYPLIFYIFSRRIKDNDCYGGYSMNEDYKPKCKLT